MLFSGKKTLLETMVCTNSANTYSSSRWWCSHQHRQNRQERKNTYEAYFNHSDTVKGYMDKPEKLALCIYSEFNPD